MKNIILRNGQEELDATIGLSRMHGLRLRSGPALNEYDGNQARFLLHLKYEVLHLLSSVYGQDIQISGFGLVAGHLTLAKNCFVSDPTMLNVSLNNFSVAARAVSSAFCAVSADFIDRSHLARRL